jgi:hypothetical protein
MLGSRKCPIASSHGHAYPFHSETELDMPVPQILRTPLDVVNATNLSINPVSGRVFVSNLNPMPAVVPLGMQALDIDSNGQLTFAKAMPLPTGSIGLCPVEEDQFVVFESVGTMKAVTFDAKFNAVQTTHLQFETASKFAGIQSMYAKDIKSILGVAFDAGSPPANAFIFNPYLGTLMRRSVPFDYGVQPTMAYDSRLNTLFVSERETMVVLPFDLKDLGLYAPISTTDYGAEYDVRSLTSTTQDNAMERVLIVAATDAIVDELSDPSANRERFLLIYLASPPARLIEPIILGKGPADIRLVSDKDFVYVVDVNGIMKFSLEDYRMKSVVPLPNNSWFREPEVIMDKARNRIHLLNVDPSGPSELLTIDCNSIE